MEKKIFESSCDLNFVAKIITILFILIIPFLCYYLPQIDEYKAGYCAVIGVIAFGALYAWGFHPQKFLLTGEQLVVKRPFVNAKYDIKNISRIEDITSTNYLNFRAWGSRGLFGYFGFFFSSEIGWYYLYAGNYERLILIEFKNGKKIVINPSDSSFHKELLEKSKQS